MPSFKTTKARADQISSKDQAQFAASKTDRQDQFDSNRTYTALHVATGSPTSDSASSDAAGWQADSEFRRALADKEGYLTDSTLAVSIQQTGTRSSKAPMDQNGFLSDFRLTALVHDADATSREHHLDQVLSIPDSTCTSTLLQADTEDGGGMIDQKTTHQVRSPLTAQSDKRPDLDHSAHDLVTAVTVQHADVESGKALDSSFPDLMPAVPAHNGDADGSESGEAPLDQDSAVLDPTPTIPAHNGDADGSESGEALLEQDGSIPHPTPAVPAHSDDADGSSERFGLFTRFSVAALTLSFCPSV
jgi:hypothetical protein